MQKNIKNKYIILLVFLGRGLGNFWLMFSLFHVLFFVFNFVNNQNILMFNQIMFDIIKEKSTLILSLRCEWVYGYS